MPRKPIGHEAMTQAKRKQEQVSRQWTRILEQDQSEWTESDCFLVLRSSRFPSGTPMDKAAWEQLGKLRGYLKSEIHEKETGRD